MLAYKHKQTHGWRGKQIYQNQYSSELSIREEVVGVMGVEGVKGIKRRAATSSWDTFV